MNSRVIDHPVNPELLYLQNEHKSYDLFRDPESDQQINVRRCDGRFFAHIETHPIPQQVMRHIRAAGFGGVIDGGYRKVDHALLTALIERWRPETHTFHLPIGEVTVTLQDVQVLWGLPIEGDVVTGEDNDFTEDFTVSQLCEDMMGFTPDLAELNGNKIKLRYLLSKLSDPLDHNEESYIRRARIYIMCLLGGTIFPDSSFNSVFLLYLQNLTNLSRPAQLSWGSAVIASLYRNLCKATKRGVLSTQGPMLLLQLWAWERIGAFAPTILGNNYNFQTAYGARWDSALSYQHTPAHVLRTYRSILTDLQDYQFNWTPYNDVLHRLPEWCTNGNLSWRSDTFVVFWDIVEPHLPNRVLRQFGFIQDIPALTLLTPEQHSKIHKVKRSGRRNVNWRVINGDYINIWYTRHQNPATGVPSANPYATQAYVSWFLDRTLIFVADLSSQQQNRHQFPDQGSQLQLLRDGMTQIHHRSRHMMDTDPMNSQQYQSIDDITRQYMHLTNADERMNFQTSYVINEPYMRDQSVPERVQRLSRRAGRQLRDELDTSIVHDVGGPSSIHDVGGPSSTPNVGTSSNVPLTGGNIFNDMGNQDYYTPYPLDEQTQLNLFNQSSDIFPRSPQMFQTYEPFHTPHMRRSSLSPVQFDFDINTIPNLGDDDTVVEDEEDVETHTESETEIVEQRNVARDRGRRQIRRPGCGTHHRR